MALTFASTICFKIGHQRSVFIDVGSNGKKCPAIRTQIKQSWLNRQHCSSGSSGRSVSQSPSFVSSIPNKIRNSNFPLAHIRRVIALFGTATLIWSHRLALLQWFAPITAYGCLWCHFCPYVKMFSPNFILLQIVTWQIVVSRHCSSGDGKVVKTLILLQKELTLSDLFNKSIIRPQLVSNIQLHR